jgi:hypothetical protein
MAREAGLDGLYLVAWVEGKPWGVEYTTHDADGFDAAVFVQFPFVRNASTRLRDRLRAQDERFGPARYEYREEIPPPVVPLAGRLHPSAQPNWDNTPRSTRRGAVALHTSPDRFERQMTHALRSELDSGRPADEQLVVVKSWNEWAEGNYVEPDERYGRGWLEAIARARRNVGLT